MSLADHTKILNNYHTGDLAVIKSDVTTNQTDTIAYVEARVRQRG
jgi:hypothetical protein